MLFDATAFWLYDNRESLMIDQVLGADSKGRRKNQIVELTCWKYVDEIWLS